MVVTCNQVFHYLVDHLNVISPKYPNVYRVQQYKEGMDKYCEHTSKDWSSYDSPLTKYIVLDIFTNFFVLINLYGLWKNSVVAFFITHS